MKLVSLTLKELWSAATLLPVLIARELRARYASSFVGILWAFVNPLFMMTLIWFITSRGVRSLPASENGLVWLFSGMICWNFLSEAISGSCHSVVEYSFLVKRVNFKSIILPLVKIGASCLIHLVFVGLILGLAVVLGVFPKATWLGIIYFLGCSLVLLTGYGWLFAAINVFFRDLANFISIALQVGFWATPIFWSYKTIPEAYQMLMYFNPFFYVVEGYRGSLFGFTGTPFVAGTLVHLIFWVQALLGLFLGVYIFSRLKPLFADVI